MKLIDGIPVFGEVEEKTLAQMRTAVKTASRGALMADNHYGYGVPIGGVLAYDEAISPSGVGYDIACGNMAAKTDLNLSDLGIPHTSYGWWIEDAMNCIFDTIAFGVGRKNEETVDHDLFDDPAWQLPYLAALRDKAAAQLGTVGSGNHYVDLFVDEGGWLWIGVHFGSRGFGHGVATHALNAGGAGKGMDSEPLVLSVFSDLGNDYLQGMALAGRYAYAGREWVVNRVAQILSVDITETVHNHHNFAWREIHDDRWMWVVRKGATPAYPGQRGFVGGSMGENAVILEGFTPEFADFDARHEQKAAMYSTVHGAGRIMSRTDATGKNRKGKLIRTPRITRTAMDAWLAEAGVVLRGAGVDEAPQAYKRLPDVLAAHANTVRILHTLRPVGVAMAGADVRDPYKD